MKRVALTLMFALAACGGAQNASDSAGDNLDVQGGGGQPDNAILGVHWARGDAHSSGGAGAAGNMNYNGGDIMPSAVTAAIFWGTSWAGYSGDKISGIDSWYKGFGGSNYAKTSDEYTGVNSSGQKDQVGASSTHIGTFVDTSSAPHHAPRTSAIGNEACSVLNAHGITPVTNGYYAVYVDTKRGGAGYCAWHSWGTCNGVNIQFAFFFNLDNDAGCDPQDSSGLHSQGLAAIANVSGHELSEARTDPRGAGWFDSSGGENGDKCAWTFGAPLVSFSNGTQWKIQGEWSNAAFSAGTGYPNLNGQNGCIGNQ
jgi:hypothetical protein